MIMKSNKSFVITAIGIITSHIMGTNSFSLSPSPAVRTLSPNTLFYGATISSSTTTTTTHVKIIPAASRSSTSSLRMRNGNNNNDNMSVTDRALSCLPYLLPLVDGDRYGRVLFALVPTLGAIDSILLGPFNALFAAIPFLQLICFFGFTILARNPEISRPVRFNLQQAVILDIALFFPSLLGQVMSSLPFALPRFLVEGGSNFIFLALLAAVGYSVVSNVSGKVPNGIPVVSDAVETQIGM